MNNLRVNDHAVQGTHASLEEQIEAMMRAAARIHDINNEVQQHFQAACSTKYTDNLNAWEGKYASLQSAYRTFQEAFAAGHRQVGNAHEEAAGVGGGWGGGHSDAVYKGLNP
ncbi:hypothetical protein ACGF13_34715 [Kitasatospora sp. NPDC048286]|uniref:hypothetical protein n=1 Tax=Kitasatospora sp. NPDC048286 TaxID=3364047 RepID=UPI00371E4597